MIPLPLTAAKKILCLGAHSDDIEIGLGGTLIRLLQERSDLAVRWVVFTAPGTRADEARRSAESILANVSDKVVRVGDFRESYFPSEWPRIKDWFEEIRRSFEPDLVFTHFRDDRHQDHRVLSDLAWNTFRNHLVLEYEIPKYDGDLGRPNTFVPLTDAQAEAKVAVLMKHFQTQTNKHWFTEDLFYAMMRIRGMECGSRFAEAFHARKLVL
jgi:LmbE family N-acetylglucosaminyl deacetylase